MSSKVPVAYVDIRVFSHATEDVDKVLAAVRNVLPLEFVDAVVFERKSLTGHHGNPILLLETRVKEKDVARAVFGRLCSSLSFADKERLSDEIVQHVDRGNLYVRLDKQSAFLNEFRLGMSDPIHLRIHFKKHGLDEVLDVCRQSGLVP